MQNFLQPFRALEDLSIALDDPCYKNPHALMGFKAVTIILYPETSSSLPVFFNDSSSLSSQLTKGLYHTYL